MGIMEPTTYEVQELRTKFFQKLEEEHGTVKGVFHPADIARITKNDDWLKRFLISHDLDIKDALTMLWETCEWRKENKVNDINEQNVNLDYLEEGSLFTHNRDKDGKTLLIFKCKKHVKGQKNFEELKRMVIYWFERTERKDKGDQMTIFFDMTDSGISNLDMEYTKYLIGLCKSYYPNFLNYILIFEMPWVLNAAFKVIKNWLPTKAVQKIKFVTRQNLGEYVTSDQALKCWGGNDDYTYKFVPETTDLHNGKLEDNKKKVHFADGSPLVEIAPSFGDVKLDDSPVASLKLKINPSEAVMFVQDGTDLSGLITLINISDHALTYKIKTTSPEKFRVRPSCGLLNSNNVSTINVVLQPGLQPSSILREKFLIMSFLLDEDSSSSPVVDLVEAWKHVDSKKVEQHRLKCTLSGQANSSSANGNVFSSVTHIQSNDVDKKINQLVYNVRTLTQCSSEMQATMKRSHNILLFMLALIILIAIALIYLTKKLLSQETGAVCYQPIPFPTNEKQEL